MFPLSQGDTGVFSTGSAGDAFNLGHFVQTRWPTHWVLGHPRTLRSVRNSASCIRGHPIFRACWADHVPLAPNFTYRWAMTARSRRSRLHGGALVGVAVPEQSWISKLHCSKTASQATPQRHRRRANATGGKDIKLRRTNARTVGSRFAHGI